MNIKVLDNVKIQSAMTLSSDDLSVLALLYQPLISSNGFTLYITMFTLLGRETLTYTGQVKHVLNITNLTLKEFEDAKSKLEAIGLLNSYKKENDHLYEMIQPLSANEFIMDGSLGVYLFSEVGEDHFKQLSKQFKITQPSKRGYENVTKNFSDVFSSHISYEDVNGKYRKRKNPLLHFESEFNFDLFSEGLSKNFFNQSMLTDKLKDTLIKLAFTYGLDEADMRDAYLRSINSSGKLDYRTFPKETRKQYQYKTGMESPTLNVQMNEVKGEGLLNHLQTVTPQELLQELSGMPAAPTELSIVYKLMNINNMSPEMVNLLIYYVLKINNGKMPGYTYFGKIASEWGRNGLDNVEKAYQYIQRKQKARTPKKKANDTWVDEYRKARRDKEKKDYEEAANNLKDQDFEEIKNKFFDM